ncbi:hypothetical protein PVAG01_11050 [Phlyctema vagabunda]|uniref:Uncharacterized protein n=1 Tax=Phlyctema vagabunda TaxID=108571 RepID=A0ABR4P401_9HELO
MSMISLISWLVSQIQISRSICLSVDGECCSDLQILHRFGGELR